MCAKWIIFAWGLLSLIKAQAISSSHVGNKNKDCHVDRTCSSFHGPKPETYNSPSPGKYKAFRNFEFQEQSQSSQINSWSSIKELDKPVQLVYPDQSSHKQLVLHKENLRLLQLIQEPIATVAVVGKFHTGKSFLLNQLMGKQAGFGVGPFVRPETMGIWMWGKPLKIKLQDGQEVALVFLDTEGFAATNVSESYDAKVFAVATLLSSYLIYNSVKIIDQGDIDYLELLSRRTQLFALKSQMSKAKWNNDFNHDLLKFPPLLWVVQDFVQLTENNEDPTSWLHRLLASPAKDSEEHAISLKAIFPSVECHTLFFPATKKAILQDLSKAREEDLTEEYREERDELLEKMRRSIRHKGKNGSPITGPELASLLEILVEAANEGSLAQIPSRWNTFLEKLERTANEDCLEFYEGEMALLHNKYDHGPIPPVELQEWHEIARDKAAKLLSHLLFGLGNATDDSSRSLSRRVEQSHEKAVDMNDKKTMLMCSDVQRRIELDAEEEMDHVQLPVTSTLIREVFSNVEATSTKKYATSLSYLSEGQGYKTHLERLKISLRNLRDSYELRNTKALEQVLKKASDRAIELFQDQCSNKERSPRTPKLLSRILENAKLDALQVFRDDGGIAVEERFFKPFLAMLQTRLEDETLSIRQDNMELLKTQAEVKVKELLVLFRDSTSGNKIILPLNQTDLDMRLGSEMDRVKSLYSSSQVGFEEFDVIQETFKLLQEGLEAICKERHHENMIAYSKEVEVPLRTSKKIVLLAADNYDTEFSLKQYIRQVCLLNLDEGKPKHWPSPLKDTIIDNFISTDKEIKNIVISRRGLWARIKGFVQWLLWIFNMY
ncbi:guanylate-binding protein 2 [Nematostella vectensis]|uniref:guanylate-binding protein 2 n=1 Tax=Nematostella vectensis TaxID=45351 RepID=UPI0013904C65|nr:guanylate-binding protein 2 [Nematostella vectensis]